MKHLHTAYRLIALMLLVVPTKAQAQRDIISYDELIYSDHIDTLTVPYISVDAQNRPILLSARVACPMNPTSPLTPDTIKYIVISNHATIMRDDQCPTGKNPQDAINFGPFNKGIMNTMANFGALVIQSDYLGYGWSGDRIHPYLNPDLTARNVLDGFEAVLDTVKARGFYIKPDYYTINTGYSQGGSVTMDVQRYLETHASKELQDKVRLKTSICGAGAYNLELEFDEVNKEDSLCFPCSVPWMMESLMEAYNEGCLRAVDLDAIYRDTNFRQTFRKKLVDKDMSNSEITAWMCEYYGKTRLNLDDIFYMDKLTDGGSICRAIRKALHKCNLLDGNWQPEHPMILFHYSGDQVVHPQNSTEACELFGDKVTFYDENSGLNNKMDYRISGLLQMMAGEPKSHSDWALFFYAWVITGVLQ